MDGLQVSRPSSLDLLFCYTRDSSDLGLQDWPDWNCFDGRFILNGLNSRNNDETGWNRPALKGPSSLNLRCWSIGMKICLNSGKFSSQCRQRWAVDSSSLSTFILWASLRGSTRMKAAWRNNSLHGFALLSLRSEDKILQISPKGKKWQKITPNTWHILPCGVVYPHQIVVCMQ